MAQPGPDRRVAVVGGGWAGLAAAVALVQQGAQVTVFEMARQFGGRARSAAHHGHVFDNGQHILVGAYSATLDLMRTVGAPPEALLLRRPLALVDPQNRGLRLPAGPPVAAFAWGVLRHPNWPWRAKFGLLRAASRWQRQGFSCPPQVTVRALCADLAEPVLTELIDPLCVAALNTPMHQASAQVFLRVLQDALFSGPGGADLLLPRVPLAQLLPEPAAQWLCSRQARLRLGQRVQQLAPQGKGWRVDDQSFDQVVLACTAAEAARLVENLHPDWARVARALPQAAIATVWLRDVHLRLPEPMVALPGRDALGQYLFDLGALGWPQGGFACVASAADAHLDAGVQALGRRVLVQVRSACPGAFLAPDALWHTTVERRATFVCSPGLVRPACQLAPGLVAAGDHVEGPYPATLEGAVRSGQAAARLLQAA